MAQISTFTAGDGCRLAYRIDGSPSSPPLILANSIATTHRMWDRQIGELTRSFRVFRYDMRGHGGSDVPDGAYSLDRLGRDVLELLDHLDIDHTHFCGLSLGGMVGQWLGVHVPDRIDHLILSNTSAYLGPAPQWDELIRTALSSDDMAYFADMFTANWFSRHTRENAPSLLEPFRQMVLATSPKGLAGSFAAVRDADMRRVNSLITSPTLVIGGKDDNVTAASHSEYIADTISGSRLVILDGVHLLNIEQPGLFLHHVMNFLPPP